MNSDIFVSDDFGENDEKIEIKEQIGSRINFSWVRVLICALILMALFFSRSFYNQYYTKVGEFYSVNFKNDDEKIHEMKNFMQDKIDDLRLEIKDKINNL